MQTYRYRTIRRKKSGRTGTVATAAHARSSIPLLTVSVMFLELFEALCSLRNVTRECNKRFLAMQTGFSLRNARALREGKMIQLGRC